MNMLKLSGIWPVLLDTLFPARCLGCSAVLHGRQATAYCQACQEDIRPIQEPYCITCGKPFNKCAGESHLCSYCLKNGWHFSRARAVVYYSGPIAEAVKLFKYNGKMYGLETFAALTNNFYLQNTFPETDLILPVPLHVKRLRQRGFNQALVLARKLFPENKEKIDPHILERKLWTRPQTGLRGIERRRNVRNAFLIRRPEKVKNKKLLLVDDVFTTGATVNECARILLNNGAGEIEIFTFARAVDEFNAR